MTQNEYLGPRSLYRGFRSYTDASRPEAVFMATILFVATGGIIVNHDEQPCP